MKYGQFCPIAKAAEVIGERWTLLVVRELLSGATCTAPRGAGGS
jgi:DNA-binding HxlR family transcriptional regulator